MYPPPAQVHLLQYLLDQILGRMPVTGQQVRRAEQCGGTTAHELLELSFPALVQPDLPGVVMVHDTGGRAPG